MHLNFETLLQRLADGSDLTPEEAAHIESCDDCRAMVARVRRFHQAMESQRLIEPSESAIAHVEGLVTRPEKSLPLPEWARTLPHRIAELLHDTLATPQAAFAGARGGAASRRLRFEAPDLELDVLVEADGRGRRVTAQLMSLVGEPAPISAVHYLVLAGGDLEAIGKTDDHGVLASQVSSTGAIEIRVAREDCLALFQIPDRTGNVGEQ
ncbi:MAG: hypothetical protein DHS20C21_18260 [Gemmatimonadota bacterium]|nr:MAG: hypothetical protein DHS20C21_18260 [Gemmatimonadota bacterium]